MHEFDLHAALRDYDPVDPSEREARQRFLDLLQTAPRGLWRDCFPAHFTASAWLVSGDGERALLMHHRKLDRWLQPGGHADGDPDLTQVALREAMEETGLDGLEVQPRIFDLDAHRIPERASEPEHWHYDVRFVVRARGSEAFVANSESRAMAWRAIDDIINDTGIDPSIRRMASRWSAKRADNRPRG